MSTKQDLTHNREPKSENNFVSSTQASLTLNKNLKQLCKERALSLSELATLANVPKANVHSWTTGTAPNLAQLKRVADVLKVSVHLLAFGEPDPHEVSKNEILKEIFSGDIRVTLHRIDREK